MSFNFGDQPWKHSPVDDYVGFAKAPENAVVANNKSGSGGVAERKLVANSPQAIIIEVFD